VGPLIGLSWRPIPGSSMVIGAGYGIYYDTSIYQGIAIQMAQQAPLSKSLTVQNSPTCPLTLANGFNQCSATTPQTFGVDPNYRVGYVQTWNLTARRDLPGSLQMTATYTGNKGTHGAQQFLPNTYPAGGINPCPSCPVGFQYLTSGGNSTRQAGQFQLRRRLHNGFTASVLYTFSKSIDDDTSLGGPGPAAQSSAATQSSAGTQSSSGPALGGQSAATQSSVGLVQDWLNLSGQRGLSTFDQRHLLNVTVQYTTGMGMGGGTLMSGWKGRVYKEWTFLTQISAGSGLPQTPFASAVAVSGSSGFVRPNVTGLPLYAAPPGRFLNPAAYITPPAGQWGNARRDAITGPNQFSLDAYMARTFRLDSRFNLDVKIVATNALNHVTYTGWIPNINSTQFGLPEAANTMRTLQTTFRLRF
jgi:trimeric autotransporter adhesin